MSHQLKGLYFIWVLSFLHPNAGNARHNRVETTTGSLPILANHASLPTESQPASAEQCTFAGKASFYTTGSTDLTAAHRSLPWGTHLRVTNLLNRHCVLVVVNDRGPFIKSRVLDVSASAARLLDMMEAGVVPVDVCEAWVEIADPTPPGPWCAGRPADGPYIQRAPLAD